MDSANDIFCSDRIRVPDSLSTSRPDRPCDTCRKRKSRCVLKPESVTCVLCEFHGQSCTFEEHPLPRAKRKATAPEQTRNKKRRSTSERLELEQRSTDYARVRDYAELQGESLLKSTLGLQNHRYATYVGASSEHDLKILSLRPYDQARAENNSDGISFRRVSDTVYFHQHSDDESPNHDQDIEILDSIEAIIAPHGEALINLYFRIIHPSFPILHKKVYLEKYARSHREFVPPLLAAVYLLALSWWEYAPELADQEIPKTEELEAIAFRSLASSASRPKLSTVQAGLLLLQKPNRVSVWQLTSQIVAIGQDLGLHRDCSSWYIPRWERGLRKRLAWALYMQSTWSSLVLGRPLLFSPLTSDWTVRNVMSDDFPESSIDENSQDGSTEVETGRVMFSAMISLTKLVAEVLNDLYSTKAESDISTATDRTEFVLSRAKALQIRLKQWYRGLPESLRISSNAKVGKLSSVGSLHASYFASEMTLHRAVLHSLTNRTDPYLVQICRSAAKERLRASIGMFNSLRAEHLESFWYFPSSYNFALTGVFAALCMATSLDQNEAQYYQQQLQAYRWRLKVSGKNIEFLKCAVQILESSVGAMLKPSDRRTSDEILQPNMPILSPTEGTSPEMGPYTALGFDSYSFVNDGQSDFFTPQYVDSAMSLGLQLEV